MSHPFKWHRTRIPSQLHPTASEGNSTACRHDIFHLPGGEHQGRKTSEPLPSRSSLDHCYENVIRLVNIHQPGEQLRMRGVVVKLQRFAERSGHKRGNGRPE